MKKAELIERLLIAGWWILAVGCVSGVLLTACTSVRYVPLETLRTEYVERAGRDSIIIRDSVFIHDKGDTIRITRWRTEYRDKLVRDSVLIRDSIQVPYPVERELTKWQSFKLDIGGLALGALILLLLVWIVRFFKR